MAHPNTETNLQDQQDQTLNENQNPPATHTEDEVPAWQAVVFESNRRASRAEQELDRLRAENERLKTPAPPPREPLDANALLNEPQKVVDRLNEDMARTVAPINEFMAIQKREKDYAKSKQDIIPNLDAAGLANFRKLEPHLDRYFLVDNPNIPLDEAEFSKAVRWIVGGLMMAGQWNPNPPTPTPKVDNRGIPIRERSDSSIPPNTRPTPGPSTRETRPKEITMDDLTENERRLARENRMTASQYVRMRDATPEEAVAVRKQIRKEQSEEAKRLAGG